MTRRHLICFGNELHGDDGFGPAVYERLAKMPLPPGLRLYAAATRGLDALTLFAGCDQAILVDAAAPHGQPGRLSVLSADDIAMEKTSHLAGHGAGLGYLLRAVSATQSRQPEICILAAEAQKVEAFRQGLSPAVAAAVTEAVVYLRCRFWGATGPIQSVIDKPGIFRRRLV